MSRISNLRNKWKSLRQSFRKAVAILPHSEDTPAELRTRKNGVERILRHAVKGMLPKGPLGRALLKNLYVYEGSEHQQEAQKPKSIDINQYK